MTLLDSLFGAPTFPVGGLNDGCRALSQDEIVQMQIAQRHAVQQAVWPLSYLEGLANYQPPQAPLDERFRDFKARLASAIERRRSFSALSEHGESRG